MSVLRMIDTTPGKPDEVIEHQVTGFREATKILTHELDRTASEDFTDKVMRQWRAQQGANVMIDVSNGRDGDRFKVLYYM